MQTKLVRKDSDQLADIIVKSVLAVAEKDGLKVMMLILMILK